MLNRNDLRAGNWIQDPDRAMLDDNNGYRQVVGFDTETCWHIYVGSNYKAHSGNSFKKLLPIPLTEKIIEQLNLERGVKNLGYAAKRKWFLSQYTTLNHCYIKANGGVEEGWWEIRFEDSKVNTFLNIKYLHELQNFYYAYNQKELDVHLKLY